VASGYVDYVLEQLKPLGAVRARSMFGGHGVYCGALFFALIASETLYFKVDDANRADYERHGKQPFMPFPDKPEMVMSYYEVPADVIEDPEELVRWAQRALAVALRAASKKAAPRAAKTQKKRTSRS
jgi:DNA transformation protein